MSLAWSTLVDVIAQIFIAASLRTWLLSSSSIKQKRAFTKYIWPSSDILGPVLPASIAGKQMAIMSRREQDPGAAQPTLFIYQGHEITSWALHAIHSARAPSPHFLQHLHGSLSTSASWVRQKLPDCSPTSFTGCGWKGCCCHTKIHLAKSWPSFGSAVRIKAQSWTKYSRCWWPPTGHHEASLSCTQVAWIDCLLQHQASFITY